LGEKKNFYKNLCDGHDSDFLLQNHRIFRQDAITASLLRKKQMIASFLARSGYEKSSF